MIKNETLERNCPQCNFLIQYKRKFAYNRGVENKTLCHKCRATFGKENYRVTCKSCGKERSYSNKYNAINAAKGEGTCRSCTMRKTQHETSTELWDNSDYREKVSNACKTGWNKYWEVQEHRDALSKRTTAKNLLNWQKPEYREKMYEKLKKTNGIGLDGHYKGVHFRSTLELKFMIEFLEGKIWKSCEIAEFCIPYVYENKTRNYYPDFFCEGVVYEIKPRFMFSDPIVQTKIEAAKKWCKIFDYQFEILDPGHYTRKEMNTLHHSGIIILSKKIISPSVCI